ncbi:MAG: phosphoglycerate dehydrogenase [Parvibaculales bacterium]
MPKVLISDKMSPRAEEIFKQRGIEVDVITGLDRDELIKIIDQYDGLAVRSSTKATPPVIEAAKNLKVIGRAGIGVDNIDLPAATAQGVVVMNTPFGNSITTAEHAIAMMFALARQLPTANASTHEGKWEKSRFMGVEVSGKVLGVIGCGNIGANVATRALGLKMKVVAFDPFLTPERAVDIGVEKVELDELLGRADFITLHTPLTDTTRNIIDAEALAKTKPGVRIINCARGGLVAEKDLKAALDSGHVAGAALDVFESEPAKESDFFGMENVVCTPHLGASTEEAQINVAIQVAEQMSDYLLSGAVTNAINMPSISAEDAPRLSPFVTLSEQLGLLAGQVTESALKGVNIEYAGDVGELNTAPLTSATIAGILRPLMAEVNMVSAPAIAKERGISISETKSQSTGAYDTYIRVTVETEKQSRSVAGTIFSNGQPRVIQVKGINMDAELAPRMLYVTNNDQPGFIGALGTVLGRHGINIASFSLGREKPGGDAISLIAVDTDVSPAVLEEVQGLEQVLQVKALTF